MVLSPRARGWVTVGPHPGRAHEAFRQTTLRRILAHLGHCPGVGNYRTATMLAAADWYRSAALRGDYFHYRLGEGEELSATDSSQG